MKYKKKRKLTIPNQRHNVASHLTSIFKIINSNTRGNPIALLITWRKMRLNDKIPPFTTLTLSFFSLFFPLWQLNSNQQRRTPQTFNLANLYRRNESCNIRVLQMIDCQSGSIHFSLVTDPSAISWCGFLSL